MNQILIDMLKERRKRAGLLQKDVAEYIGKAPSLISEYENGKVEPDIDIFFQLCKLYEITDYAGILADTYSLQRYVSDITIEEYEFIKKRRDLDPHGRRVADFVLQAEYERSVKN